MNKGDVMEGEEAEEEVEEVAERSLAKRFGGDDFILLHDTARNWVVRVGEIIMLEASGNDTIVHLPEGKITIRKLIGRCGEALDGSLFFRAGRSCVVNLNFVRKVEMADAKRFMFVMGNGREVIVSRKRSAAFRREKAL
jgi:two-component system, LytTR family, response regulator